MRLYDRHVVLLEELLTIQRKEVPVIKEFVRPSRLMEFEWRTTYEVEYAASVGSALDWVRDQTERKIGRAHV